MVLEPLFWIFCYDRTAVTSFAGTNCHKTKLIISEEAQFSLAAPVLCLWLASGRAQWCWHTILSQLHFPCAPASFSMAYPMCMGLWRGQRGLGRAGESLARTTMLLQAVWSCGCPHSCKCSGAEEKNRLLFEIRNYSFHRGAF